MCIKKERFRYSAKESALKVCCRFWWFSRLNDGVVEMVEKAQSLETIETKVCISTYTRRAGGARTLGCPFPQRGGAPQSAARRTGVRQRGAGGTDAKQE